MGNRRNHGAALLGLATICGASAALALLLPRSAKASVLPPGTVDLPAEHPDETAQPADLLLTPQAREEDRPPSDPRARPPWEPARLTEYYPDAPASQRGREGGRFDRFPGRDKHPVIWWEQYKSDPDKYPFVTASGDLKLRGRKVPYGARLYIEAYPDVEFRLMDTGGNFFGDGKVIRVPGHEPFDIAVAYPVAGQPRLHISGTKTRYWVDFADVRDYPSWLVVRRDPPLVA